MNRCLMNISLSSACPRSRGISSRQRIHLLAFVLVIVAATACVGRASEVQVKTADGQTITGEFLGTQDGIIHMRSKYGEISIPSKDVITMVKAPENGAAATPPDKSKKAEPDAIEAQVRFPEPKDVNLIALLAARMPDPPEPNNHERQEIQRYLRNFRDSSDKYRGKALDILSGYGEMAYPFISAEYTRNEDLEDKIQLLAAIAVAGSPYTAGIFARTHATAMAEYKRVVDGPPPLPPAYVTKKEREQAGTSGSAPTGGASAADVKAAARRVLAIEADASAAQGPFNTLFLFQVYKARYSGDPDALLCDAARDKVLLASVAADASDPKSAWQGSDRAMLADAALPLLFKDNLDLKDLAQELLKKVLPSGHPRFSASEEEWFNWWMKNREKIEKK